MKLKPKIFKSKFVIFPKECFDCKCRFTLTHIWHFYIAEDWHWNSIANDYCKKICDTWICTNCLITRAKEDELTINKYIETFWQKLIRKYKQ